MKNIKKNLRDITRKIKFLNKKRRLMNTDFTIISNNCWGGNVSRDFNLPYRSPFVGMFINSPDYLKLLSDLNHYLQQELIFTENSKYELAERERRENWYPIGLLGDVELHMVHYSSEKEAENKFNRRKERINYNNLYIKFSEKFSCTPNLVYQFDKLPYKNKIALTVNEYPELESTVKFPSLNLKDEMYNYHHFFNIVDWLNK